MRNFSHRGLEGGDRLLSITTRDGRFVHFRMPASASAARCGTWFDTEGPQHQRRRWRVGGGAQSSSGREELWKRGLWGAGTSELWMERLVDEVWLLFLLLLSRLCGLSAWCLHVFRCWFMLAAQKCCSRRGGRGGGSQVFMLASLYAGRVRFETVGGKVIQHS